MKRHTPMARNMRRYSPTATEMPQQMARNAAKPNMRSAFNVFHCMCDIFYQEIKKREGRVYTFLLNQFSTGKSCRRSVNGDFSWRFGQDLPSCHVHDRNQKQRQADVLQTYQIRQPGRNQIADRQGSYTDRSEARVELGQRRRQPDPEKGPAIPNQTRDRSAQ